MSISMEESLLRVVPGSDTFIIIFVEPEGKFPPARDLLHIFIV